MFEVLETTIDKQQKDQRRFGCTDLLLSSANYMLLDFQVTVCLRSEQVWGRTRERAGLLFSFLSVLGWLMPTANSPRARRLYKTERCLPGVMAPAVQRLGSALWSRCNLHLQFYSTVRGTACPVTAQHEGPTLLHPPARTYFLFRYEPCSCSGIESEHTGIRKMEHTVCEKRLVYPWDKLVS